MRKSTLIVLLMVPFLLTGCDKIKESFNGLRADITGFFGGATDKVEQVKNNVQQSVQNVKNEAAKIKEQIDTTQKNIEALTEKVKNTTQAISTSIDKVNEAATALGKVKDAIGGATPTPPPTDKTQSQK
ncbi:hypothetical protein HZA43_03245 [Candidatus Peregrinibacteria bacterium]|nr:hypothetical protein [Candidatus Peregrinibacteria bacterium]